MSALRDMLKKRWNLELKTKSVENALKRLIELRSLLQQNTEGEYSFAIEAFPEVVKQTITLDNMLETYLEEFREKGDMIPE